MEPCFCYAKYMALQFIAFIGAMISDPRRTLHYAMIGKTDPVYNIELFAVIGKQPAQKRCLLNYVNCRLRGTAFRRGAGPGAIFVWIACPDVIDLKWTGLLWWRFYTNDQLRSSHATHTNKPTLNLESWILNLESSSIYQILHQNETEIRSSYAHSRTDHVFNWRHVSSVSGQRSTNHRLLLSRDLGYKSWNACADGIQILCIFIIILMWLASFRRA